jgi:dethiobiotin synthetase
MRGVFVTGTGTEVGKSVVAAAVCAALAGRGERVAAFKPAVTGLDESAPRASTGSKVSRWPPDHELLASAASAGQSPADVAPHRYGPPLSPHFAAELAGETIEPAALIEAARAAGARADAVVCEGIGGLLVPITPGYVVRDFAVDLGLPVVIAARTELGTINHTMLTVEAARAAGLRVAGIVMTPWPTEPAPIQTSNRDTIERLGSVPVSGLPPTDPGSLVAAARSLPVDEWL